MKKTLMAIVGSVIGGCIMAGMLLLAIAFVLWSFRLMMGYL